MESGMLQNNSSIWVASHISHFIHIPKYSSAVVMEGYP